MSTDPSTDDTVLFEAHNVRLEPSGRVGTLHVGTRVLRFGDDLSYNYQSILLHAIATADDGSKYLYCQVAFDEHHNNGNDDNAIMNGNVGTADVLLRLNGDASHGGNKDDDRDDGGGGGDGGDGDDDDDGAGDDALSELRFVGLDESALNACYEALSRAAAMNPDLEIDDNSFFGGGIGAGFVGADAATAAALAAWDSKLDIGDDDIDEQVVENGNGDENAAAQFEDADEAAAGRRTSHDETGTPKKMRTDE